MPGSSPYLIVSVLVLAALLFFPVSRIVWMVSCRRLHRKLDRQLSDTETAAQKQRAYVIALVVVLLFSWLFNTRLLGKLYE